MESVFRILAAAGYSKESIDWLRRHRLSVIVALAILSWIVLIVVAFSAFWFAGEIWTLLAEVGSEWMDNGGLAPFASTVIGTAS